MAAQCLDEGGYDARARIGRHGHGAFSFYEAGTTWGTRYKGGNMGGVESDDSGGIRPGYGAR